MRITKTGSGGVQANCRDCGWHSDAKNAQANAARHSDARGHYVDVDSVLLIAYMPHDHPERLKEKKKK